MLLVASRAAVGEARVLTGLAHIMAGADGRRN